MTKLWLRAAVSLLPFLAVAAAPPQPVTPMTPDVVASYDPVLPEADFVRREVEKWAKVVSFSGAKSD